MVLALTKGQSSTSAPPLLRVEGLTVRFDGYRALDGIDLEVERGDTVALAGENGAGKSTLARCIGGDMAPAAGQVYIDGARIGTTPAAAARRGVTIVWQNVTLCDNLDVAENLLLGSEPSPLLRSTPRLHEAARALLNDLGIGVMDTTRRVGSLSGGERQLVAVARAMAGGPRLLVLDEPTTALGVTESARVEQLIATVRERGTTVLIVSHDIDQMFRLADRIVVLRRGRVVADVNPSDSHPEDIVAFISGQPVNSSARRQLNRLHGLADQLASAEPSSSLPLIVSALAGALGAPRLCVHLVEGERLRVAGALGLPAALAEAWSELPFDGAGGPVGVAAQTRETVIDFDIRSSPAWVPWRSLAIAGRVRSSWSVPVTGGRDRLIGVITVFREVPGYPPADERQLVNLYAGYIAGAVERERLLGEVTVRNRVLETIRMVLETLAGPVRFRRGLPMVLSTLRDGLLADRVALLSVGDDGGSQESWLTLDSAGEHSTPSTGLIEAAGAIRAGDACDGRATSITSSDGHCCMAVPFMAPGGGGILLAEWEAATGSAEAVALLEDTANSLRLAREREESERAREEASALRRSRELQRGFLSRLSHELRTPLTAIGGYASSLMARDVTWDRASETRFLTRIGAESARLGRLVADLLDFSAIESSTMRMLPDWCELPLVLDAAIACLPPAHAALIEVDCQEGLPVIWADHDRLEQIFLNLLENALRHNPPGTRVAVNVSGDERDGLVITVTDDGGGLPEEVASALFEPRSGGVGPAAGAGLGLSIAKGIVDAHLGEIGLERLDHGTRFRVKLPIGGPDPAHRYTEERDLADV
jgi:signal transduction histidine kinase/ABC-type branched-subunit amino acid transport system ATPase component